MKNYFKKVFALTDKGATDLIKACVLTIIANLILMSISGFLFLFLNDTIIQSLNNDEIIFKIALYIAYGLVLLILIFISHYFSYNANYMAAYKESANKRLSIAEVLRKLPLSFFGKKDLTDLTTSIMSDTTELETAFSHYIPQLIGSFVSTSIVSIGLLIFNYKMAIATIWVIPISLLLVICTKKYQSKFSEMQKNTKLSYDDKITECIENVKDIKANNRSDFYEKELSKEFVKFERGALKTEYSIAIPVVSSQLILKVGIATSFLMGVYLLSNNSLSFLDFIIFMMIATRIFDPIIGSLVNTAGLFHSFVSIDRMKELEKTSLQTGKTEFNPSNFDIQFNNVVFSYNNEKNVINDISFTAKQNNITALVGPSGGGKSTAIKLASRFWDVNSGNIKIGDEDIKTIDPETLLKNISIVFQDVTLFNNTVMENIRIGMENATDEEVIQAAKNAKCHEFVMNLENGYNTLIGENGYSLSGGERQRLSIARALLKDAPIILLDEATSSLDITTESLVQEAIARLIKNKTVIVIAHRMRTIVNADKIILLKDGEVYEEGTHEELMKNKKEYKKMIDLQMKSSNWSLIGEKL